MYVSQSPSKLTLCTYAVWRFRTIYHALPWFKLLFFGGLSKCKIFRYYGLFPITFRRFRGNLNLGYRSKKSAFYISEKKRSSSQLCFCIWKSSLPVSRRCEISRTAANENNRHYSSILFQQHRKNKKGGVPSRIQSIIPKLSPSPFSC